MLFAKASVVEEDVLVAQIITVQEPEPPITNLDLSSSGKTTEQTVLTISETITSKSNCATNLTEAEINPVTFENNHSTPEQNCTTYTNTNVPNMENGLVYSGVANSGLKTKTSSVNTIQTVTNITHTKVHSIVKKFEEARKPNTLKQTENGNAYLNSDIHETPVIPKNHKQPSDDVIKTESQSVESSTSINYNEDGALPKDPELVDNGQISEQAIVSTIVVENEEAIPSDLKTDINCIVDDSEISDEPCINSDSVNFVENVPTNTNSMEFVSDDVGNGDLKPASDKITSSNEPPNMLELGSDAGDIAEDPEDIVIYANQVTEVNASDGANYVVCETVEAIHARPVDDYGTTVVYASQVSDSTAVTYCGDGNNLKQANGSSGLDKSNRDKGSTTVVYANESRDIVGTTVTYTNQDSEANPQPIIETTKPSHIKIVPPNHITEDDKISTLENSDIDLTNPVPISPQPNSESQSFMETSFDATLLISSPVTNESSSELQENILNNDKMPWSSSPDPLTDGNAHEIKEDTLGFDKIFTNTSTDPVTNQSPLEVQENIVSLDKSPSSSTPVPEPKESPPESWQKLPRGETDVDSFSDIDEIDIDILPDENYQKSKSVTDLDEALASFGGLDCLSNDDQDNMTGGLSKSVPDILDSCREKFLRETVANPTETLQKKNLSLSTPEINSKPGSKKVTRIKIVHVKFLEMQSDSENVEEDSFIYEGDFPISGKIKRKSRNLSDEFSSPVASPPPDLNKEIAQERWIAEKTNLKQLEFEFGDLFENSPSSPPPPFEENDMKGESSNDGSNQGSQSNSDIHEDATKFQDASMVYSVPDNLSYETSGPLSRTSNSLKSTSESQDPTLPQDSTQKTSLIDVKNRSFSTVHASTTSTTNSSRFEVQNQRTVSGQSTSSTITYSKTSATAHSSTRISSVSKLKSDIEKSNEDVISVLPLETQVTSSIEKPHQTSSTIRSRTIMSSGTKSKVEYKNIQNSPSLTSSTSETVSRAPRNQEIPSPTPGTFEATKTDSVSFRYTPRNSHSYSTVPKPVPEHGKYVIKSGLIATQSTSKQTNTRNTTTQARYTDNPNSPRRIAQYAESPNSARHVTTQARYIDSPSSSPSSSPRHGIKLSEKFRMSDEGKLAQKPGVPSDQTDGHISVTNQLDGQVVPTNRTDGQKTRKSHQRGSSSKGTSRQDGKLVTVKSGIISDYECSSDADSEMSYNVPSPRIKAKKFHRPLVHRVDSASSSEPDSPRRQMKDARRSMSELFGVDEGSQYSSDTSKDGRGVDGFGKERGSQNSLRNQKLFSRFGNVGQSEETVRRQNETAVKSNSSPSHVYQAKTTIFDPRPIEPEANMGQNKERVASQNIVERKSSSLNVPQARVATYDQREQEDRIPNPRYSNALEKNPSPPNVYQVRATTFDPRPIDTKTYNPRYTNALERNLSPTSFLQEGNLDDQMSPKTMEFNPFEDIEGRDGFQPFERCHSPSSVYSDTSSVFSFNCDFDPMPPPTGTYEPEVYTCDNPMCRKQDILLGPEKTSFRSCPACFTFYCSSECRKLHWPSHKQSCYFGRVNTYVRSIIRLCQRREDLSMYLSQLARDGYKKKGRGVVMAIFNSPELAREFITKGHDAFSGRKPTYSSLAELHREGIISKHRVALMQAVRDYEPNQEFVFNIAVVATNNIPITPAPRYKLNTVLHCIKMPLNDLIVARQPKDYDKVETRLFALPKCSRHEFVNEMEARRHYCRNLSKNLRQYNIKLKEDYPECYRKLCLYVEHNISFEPMTVYGQRGGINYKCVLAPEQTYPLNAEYC